jgi:hypothetical protein
MIGRLGDTMCDLHRAQVDEKRGFLGLASNGFSRFCLKTGGYNFSHFGLKTGGSGFSVWASKLAALI